jgi:murein L,D-transpeptidase YcbB/YkuD
MKNLKKLLIALLLLSTITVALHAEPIPIDNNNDDVNVSYLLKKQFKKNRIPLLRHLSNKRFLRNFYYKNNYQPLWITNNGLNQEKYQELFQHINNDLTLNKHGYLLKKSTILEKEMESNLTQEETFRMEVQLTSLYYDFLKHSVYGEILWKNFSGKLRNLKRYRINARWVRKKPDFNLQTLLANPDINTTLQEIQPKKFGYQKLLKGLKKLHTMKANGGWKKLPYFKVLKLESTGEVVVQLRERLKASGDYSSCESNESDQLLIGTTNSESNESSYKASNESFQEPYIDSNAIFGECLNKAVKHFQKRHGLVVDGVVGKGTQRALNATVDEKIEKVLINIDRIKWLPRQEHERYLVVNLPEFMLHYIEDKKIKKQIRVIIGDKKHPTPIFSQEISYVVLNPYWKIPEGIVRREIIPAMIKNRNYLKKQGLVAHRTWSEKSKVINVSNLYWEQYLWAGVKFPYRLMQPPGPKNALGKIKFKFPNQFAVYLHDTPTRYLFKRDIRAFSHGCVRIAEPHSLLEIIASFNNNINMVKADKILKGKRKVQYNIKNKLPIYLVYLTAGVNEENELEFRNDIYRYDKFTKRSTK